MKEEFTYLSSDGETTIHAYKWTCEDKPKAILQIAHGMAEHIERYEDFVNYLNQNGIMVCGNNHLGHGNSIKSEKDLGYFCEENGHFAVVADMKTLRDAIVDEYPDTPYFLLGHSMGSFMTRQFIATYQDALDGVIIMGTGVQPAIALKFAKFLSKKTAKKHGWHFRANNVNKLAFGKYNKRIKNCRTGYDWLTRDYEIVDKYNADPLCGYTFTCNGFYNLFSTISYIQDTKVMANIRKDLPVLIIAGQEDPVGNYGKAPAKLQKLYKKIGIVDTNLILYPDDRHEILNEINKKEVYADLLHWIQNQL